MASNLEPYNWNVVINAFWNRAILTPDGIRMRVFKLDESAGIEIKVPLTGLDPYVVTHGNISVRASSRQLIVDADAPNRENLQLALGFSINALDALPETPVQAAGFNVRYRIVEPDYHGPLLERIANPLDGFSELGLERQSAEAVESFRFGEGLLNLKARLETSGVLALEFNFHQDSTSNPVLREWLQPDLNHVFESINRILGATIGGYSLI